MFWQRLIIVAHYLGIWSWITTIFDPKKDPKINAFLHVQKGPPFGFCMKKIVNVKSFEIFKQNPQKLPTQDLSNVERNKAMKNQLIQGILWRLVHNNQPGGIVLIPSSM